MGYGARFPSSGGLKLSVCVHMYVCTSYCTRVVRSDAVKLSLALSQLRPCCVGIATERYIPGCDQASSQPTPRPILDTHYLYCTLPCARGCLNQSCPRSVFLGCEMFTLSYVRRPGRECIISSFTGVISLRGMLQMSSLLRTSGGT